MSKGWNQEKHIVLDLDETLVHAIDDDKFELLRDTQIFSDTKLSFLRDRVGIIKLEDVMYEKGQGVDNNMWFIRRPYLRRFLAFCFNYFDTVGIWSAGADGYVQEICFKTFGPLENLDNPSYIWTRGMCETVKKDFTKPLSKMMEYVNKNSKYDMNYKNTLILDDRNYNAVCNKDNGVINPAYEPEPSVEGILQEDDCLLKFEQWLTKPEIREIKDIRLVSKDIFK